MINLISQEIIRQWTDEIIYDQSGDYLPKLTLYMNGSVVVSWNYNSI